MKKGIRRVSTGIPGLDDLIEGGIPEGSTVLVSGGPGSGKTILSLQFLIAGATKGEKGVYISLEEDTNRLRDYISKVFEWPLEKLLREKKLIMIKAEFFDFEKFKNLVENEVEKNGAKRLAIDPITVLSLFFERPLEIRRSLLELDRLLKKLECTTLLTCEIPEGSRSISSFGIEEFTSDGIILLYYLLKGYPRALSVRKMRATRHDIGIHPFEITRKGIVVYPREKIFRAE